MAESPSPSDVPFFRDCTHMLQIAFNDPHQMHGFSLVREDQPTSQLSSVANVLMVRCCAQLNTTCGQLPSGPLIEVIAQGRCGCSSKPGESPLHACAWPLGLATQRPDGWANPGHGSWTEGWCHSGR